MVVSRSNDHINGFTLVEVLFVLVIWSVLILLVIPINSTYLENQEKNHFFETFAFDMLYAQNLATTTIDRVELRLYEDHYKIGKGYAFEVLITRNIPSGWSIEPRLMRVVSFTRKGRIREPGSFVINTKHQKYSIVFPFGKGRYHIVEQ